MDSFRVTFCITILVEPNWYENKRNMELSKDPENRGPGPRPDPDPLEELRDIPAAGRSKKRRLFKEFS